MIPVLSKQNINLAMCHTSMPSNTKPKTNLIIRHSLLLVKKYFLIIAAYFGAYTKATISLNCSKIKMHNRDTRFNSIVKSHTLQTLIPIAFSYFCLLVILSLKYFKLYCINLNCVKFIKNLKIISLKFIIN